MFKLKYLILMVFVALIMAFGMFFQPSHVHAQGWSCDGPPQDYVDACNEGNCSWLWLYWNWYSQNC